MAKKTTTTTTTTVVTEDSPESADLLIFVLDRSGSMASQQHQAWPAVQRFLHEQKQVPGLRAILVAFDNEYEVLAHNEPMRHIASHIFDKCPPRGGTALLDAVGRAVMSAESLTPAPKKVLLAVYTDGEENASREWTKHRLSMLVGKKREEGWAVLYLGAEQAAWAAESLGFGVGVSHRSGHFAQTMTASSTSAASYYAGAVSARGLAEDVATNAGAESVVLTTPTTKVP